MCKLDSARRGGLGNARLVSAIVDALPSRVRFLVLTNDRAAFTITPAVASKRIRFVALPEESSTTIWPQDPFLVLEDGRGGVRLLASKTFTRADDRVIAEHLAEYLDIELDVSDLLFEGGNIVADDEHVFIGGDTVAANVEALGDTWQTVISRFRKELGREVVVLGTVGQPIAHLDMILTPLGEGRLLVADAGWGARLAEESLKTMQADVDAFERQCERMFFGHPAIREVHDADGKVVRPVPVAGQTTRAIAESRVVAPGLDELAQALTDHGYTVERVPFLFAHPGRSGTSSTDSVARDGDGGTPSTPAPAGGLPEEPDDEDDPFSSKGIGYPVLTYSNVLMETGAAARTVYLPQYGFRALDRAAARVWRDLGWRVEPVGGLTTSAMHRGSLRCCVKVLRRDRAAIEAGDGREKTRSERPRRIDIIDASLHSRLGIALMSQGKYSEAAREFRHALTLCPGDTAAHANLAGLLQRGGRVAEAVVHFRQALAGRPGSSQLCMNLADALLLLGDIEEARRTYRKALELDPANLRAHMRLGAVYRKTGDVRGALEHFREILRARPDNEEARSAVRELEEEHSGTRR